MRAHTARPGLRYPSGCVRLCQTIMGRGFGGTWSFRIHPHLEVVQIAGVRGRVGVLPTKLGKVQRRSRGQLMELQRQAHGENFASKIHDGDWWALWLTLHLIFSYLFFFFFLFFPASVTYIFHSGPLFSRFSSTLSPCSFGAVWHNLGREGPSVNSDTTFCTSNSLCKHYWRGCLISTRVKTPTEICCIFFALGSEWPSFALLLIYSKQTVSMPYLLPIFTYFLLFLYFTFYFWLRILPVLFQQRFANYFYFIFSLYVYR